MTKGIRVDAAALKDRAFRSREYVAARLGDAYLYANYRTPFIAQYVEYRINAAFAGTRPFKWMAQEIKIDKELY